MTSKFPEYPPESMVPNPNHRWWRFWEPRLIHNTKWRRDGEPVIPPMPPRGNRPAPNPPKPTWIDREPQQSLVIKVDIPDGVDIEATIEKIKELALAADAYHRALGGHGLKIEEPTE